MTTKQIHLRVDDDLRDAMGEYATNYGISVADAARILIKKGLADGGWIPAHPERIIQRGGTQS